jgi:hypothetical protein
MHGVTAMETPAVEAAHPTMEAFATTASSDNMDGRRLALRNFRHGRGGARCCGHYCGSNSENSKIVHDHASNMGTLRDSKRVCPSDMR